MFCSNCGKELPDNAYMCPNCGAPTSNSRASYGAGGARQAGQKFNDLFSHNKNIDSYEISDKDWMVALLLAFFVGFLGVHNFYVGKIGIGIAQLLTLGGCGVWMTIDIVMLVCQKYTDGDGKLLINKM